MFKDHYFHSFIYKHFALYIDFSYSLYGTLNIA